MRIDFKYDLGLLEIFFHPEKNEGVFSDKVRMARNRCMIRLPMDYKIEDTHPDLLALAAILIIYPFTNEKIELPFGVSREFHNVFLKRTKKYIEPVNEKLKPRKVSACSVPALAYSGGVDSTAALTLLPKSTVLFFLDRVIPDDISNKSLYDKDAAHYSCEYLRNIGRSVYMLQSDLEYIREPVGFPVDIANAVPILLLADYIDIDSIAFGTIMESAYRIGHLQYADYKTRIHFSRWGDLFKIVGTPFNQVVAGISEVGTSKIVLNSPFANIAQSCMRGKAQEPCMNCWKCFRKGLLDRILEEKEIHDELLNNAFKIKEARRFLLKEWIKHQNVIQYITNKYYGNHPLMLSLKKKVMGEVNVDWLEKWYPRSIELLPEKYKEIVKKNILKYLDEMDERDIVSMEGYNLGAMIKTDEYIYNEKRFAKLMEDDM